MRRIKLARRLQYILDFLPRKYPIHSPDQNFDQPFFIFGSGRNGSTMLNRMLNGHGELFLPSEQYFLGNSIIKFKLYNFLIWRDLVKIITGELLPSTGSHTWDFGPDEVFQALNESSDKSLQQLIDTIYRVYGNKSQSFSKWGDTTPLNTFYIPEIYSVFPRAKYIFLVRDGRDVVASYKKGGEYLGKLSDPIIAANHWMNSIEKYDWLAKRNEVKCVQYEDLVHDPIKILSEICHFLGVDFQESMLDFYKEKPKNELYAEPQHANLGKPVFASSIGNYMSSLEGQELSTVEKIINVGLDRFKYI
ncbi:MAG: protein-tyrosine sulfotransferase [Marinoscillum sp.]|jgi:protein-tyrosine sulfotransferase